MSRDDAMLDADGLAKRYPGADRPALDDVDLTVAPGEVFGLVGRSGSGKTTLLRLVAGLEAPSSGRVQVAGRVVADPGTWVPPEERPVGMLFQEGALFPHLDVAGNVEFGIRGLPRGRRRRRRHAVLELVGLEGHADRHPHQLSGGERRRVALARALAPEPELLLLDEPFTGLDEDLTARLREAVSRVLAETGITALLVLHDTDEILPMADRIGALRDGRLAQVGRPEDVYTRPHTSYVARLFGPANIVPAVREADGLRTPLGLLSRGAGAADRPPAEGAVQVCFRPEELEVVGTGAEGGGVPATVVEAGYRGDRLEARARVEAGGGEAACVLTLHLPAGLHVRPGELLRVRPRAEAGHPLDGGSAEG